MSNHECEPLNQAEQQQIEADLIAAAQDDDPDAYGQIVAMHYPRILQKLTYKAGEHAAEDLTQEVFLRGFLRIKSFVNDGRGMLPYFETAANNIFIDNSFPKKKQHEILLPEGYMFDHSRPLLTDPQPTPEAVAIANMSVEQFATAIATWIHEERLLPSQAEVFLQRYQGITLEEIAAERHISVGAVKQLRLRGHTKILQLLHEESFGHRPSPEAA